MTNAAEQKGVKQITAAQEKLLSARDREDWVWLTTHEQGLRVINTFMAWTGYRDVLNLRGDDAVYALGRRAPGVLLLNRLRTLGDDLEVKAERAALAPVDPVRTPPEPADA
jgi:hypothetical protein